MRFVNDRRMTVFERCSATEESKEGIDKEAEGDI